MLINKTLEFPCFHFLYFEKTSQIKDFKEAFKWLEKAKHNDVIIKKEKSSFLLQREKIPENCTCTLKLSISASESHRKLKLGLIELYGNTE